MGSVYEASDRWAEAASVYARAGRLDNYAVSAGATASAIRAYIHAGQPSDALGLADELALRAPDFALPQFLQAQVDELRMTATPN